MNTRDLANQEADRIEADESLTDEEKRHCLRELDEELYEIEHPPPNNGPYAKATT